MRLISVDSKLKYDAESETTSSESSNSFAVALQQEQNFLDVLTEKEIRLLQVEGTLSVPFSKRPKNTGLTLNTRALRKERQALLVSISDLNQELVQIRRQRSNGIGDPATWRSFHDEFEVLAKEELASADAGIKGECLVAGVSYEHPHDEIGTWLLYGTPNERLKSDFRSIAARAGLGLQTPLGVAPEGFWLRCLFLHLLANKSKYLRFARRANESGVVEFVCRASAIFCNHLVAESAAAVAGTSPAMVSRSVSEQSAAGHERTHSYVGRRYKRPAQFDKLAGELWGEAKKSGRVELRKLARIAAELDKAGFIPPADFLEGCFSDSLKAYNSQHANSKTGPVKTWKDLIEINDKDHVRGMRKLLSRCSGISSVVRK